MVHRKNDTSPSAALHVAAYTGHQVTRSAGGAVGVEPEHSLLQAANHAPFFRDNPLCNAVEATSTGSRKYAADAWTGVNVEFNCCSQLLLHE